MASYPLLIEHLNLSNVRVTHYQLVSPSRIDLFIESTLPTADCPDCGKVSTELHDIG